QEQPGLGVHDGGHAWLGGGHDVRGALQAGGEADPGGVVRAGTTVADGGGRAPVAGGRRDVVARNVLAGPHDAVGGHQHADARLAEDEGGALVGVVGVHGDVGGARVEGGEDGRVEVVATRGQSDADPVAPRHPGGGEFGCAGVDLGTQLGVGQHALAVVDRGGVRVGGDGGVEDVDQGARGGGALAATQRIGRPARRSPRGSGRGVRLRLEHHVVPASPRRYVVVDGVPG